MLELKFKRLTDTMKLPTKAHETDACFDIYADTLSFRSDGEIRIAPHETIKIRTGFATEIPKGYFAAVFARSGLSINNGLRPGNCVGVIDSSYRNEWIVGLHNDTNEIKIIQHGDRIAQFCLLPVFETNLVEVNELGGEDRGGGLGSTGV